MKILLLLVLFPFLAISSEKEFMKEVNKNCANIGSEKEKAACVSGTFINFCQKPTNKKFCNKEAALADYSKRTEGAKKGLKKIYKALAKAKKETGSYSVDLRKIFKENSKDVYFYFFGVPSSCKSLVTKYSPTNSQNLHGLYARAKEDEKALINAFDKQKCLKKGGFRFYAIGQVDDDSTFDIWYVDHKKRIKHFRSDLKR
jgi:hypothetical protein